ncbi:hypothetical protein LIER_32662 [Lithospermum erythrorhizon]|uniref:Reverse transcriptase zinc-binding domain-containing protein n=1 Tax=Lithospermum erythrorhizon TaxID=34254 RepID=A0AAV3RY51_LITER
MKMPETVKEKVEKLMNKFLWSEGTPWCSWKKFCAPFSEGGSHSRFWKALVDIREHAEANLHWQVGRGECDLWVDSWLPTGPLDILNTTNAKVSDFYLNGQWNEGKLQAILDSDRVNVIMQLYLDPCRPDQLLWKPSPSGEFTFKSAWEEVRTGRDISIFYSSIWHSTIPRKMSFLTWRLLRHLLPVDEVLQTKGISLASKCHCCSSIETIEHVFFTNPVAERIWAHFGALFGVSQANISTVTQAITTWSLSARGQGHVRQVVPVVIL